MWRKQARLQFFYNNDQERDFGWNWKDKVGMFQNISISG